LALERTLFIVKPDAVRRNLIGRILAHVEEHAGKPFFNDLVGYMTSGPVLLVCLERESAITRLREVVGATDPAEAAPGTVRRLYGESKQYNSVHASDSPASAGREVKFFFGVAALTR